MCGSDGRLGGNSCAVEVAGEEPDEPDSAASSEGPEDGRGDIDGLSMLSALSMECFTLSFFSNTLHSKLSRRDAGSGSRWGNLSTSRSRRSLSFSWDHRLKSSAH